MALTLSNIVNKKGKLKFNHPLFSGQYESVLNFILDNYFANLRELGDMQRTINLTAQTVRLAANELYSIGALAPVDCGLAFVEDMKSGKYEYDLKQWAIESCATLLEKYVDAQASELTRVLGVEGKSYDEVKLEITRRLAQYAIVFTALYGTGTAGVMRFGNVNSFLSTITTVGAGLPGEATFKITHSGTYTMANYLTAHMNWVRQTGATGVEIYDVFVTPQIYNQLLQEAYLQKCADCLASQYGWTVNGNSLSFGKYMFHEFPIPVSGGASDILILPRGGAMFVSVNDTYEGVEVDMPVAQSASPSCVISSCKKVVNWSGAVLMDPRLCGVILGYMPVGGAAVYNGSNPNEPTGNTGMFI